MYNCRHHYLSLNYIYLENYCAKGTRMIQWDVRGIDRYINTMRRDAAGEVNRYSDSLARDAI